MRKKYILKFFISFILVFCIFATALPVSAAGFDPGIEEHSKALLLINLDTGTTVYEKNADEKMEPASITKIMTYIVAFENISDVNNTVITVPQKVEDELSGTGSSMSGVSVGEELTAFQLLNLMMVPSGNDAALTLALYVGQTEEAFAELMNKKAAELGCTNTHFMNPHGLHNENHYTSARDIAIITQYAMSLPYFTDITSQLYYTLPPTNINSSEKTVYTTNRMMNQNADDGAYYYRYTKGIKTGSHDEAGYCLVSTAICDGYSYLCVALGSPCIGENGEDILTHGEMLDSKALYEWAFDNLEIKSIVKTGEVKGEVKVEHAWNKDSVLLYAETGFSTVLPYNVETSSIIYKYDLPESISAPVEKGDKIGTVTLIYADTELATINLLAAESIEKNALVYTFDIGKDLFFSNWFVSVISLLVFLLILYIILALLYNRKKKKMRKAKEYIMPEEIHKTKKR